MKIRSSQVIVAIIVIAGLVVALAVLRSPRPDPKKVALDSTDKFLSQVNDIRERGGGSSVKTGQVLSIEKKMPDKPSLQLETEEVDMGLVPSDRPSQKRIAVKNIGENPVDIIEVRTSCYCTEGKFEQTAVTADGRQVSTIAPGAEMGLMITVHPDRIHGFYANKELTITTNDPVTQQYFVDVITHVNPELSIEPQAIDFGTVQRGTPAEVRCLIRQASDTPVNISNVQIPGIPTGDPRKGATVQAPVTMELIKRPESEWQTPGRVEWDLVARIAADAPVGDFTSAYWLLTDIKRIDTNIEKIEGKITASVVTFFDVVPASLGARNVVSPGQAGVAAATITSSNPITISDLTISGNDLSVEAKPGPSPTQAEIVLNVKPEATGGLKNETVTFTVTSGGNTAKHSMRAFVSIQAQAAPAPAA